MTDYCWGSSLNPMVSPSNVQSAIKISNVDDSVLAASQLIALCQVFVFWESSLSMRIYQRDTTFGTAGQAV